MLGGCKSEDLPLPSEKKFLGEHSQENEKEKEKIPMILSNPVGWVRDGDIQIFTYYIKV